MATADRRSRGYRAFVQQLMSLKVAQRSSSDCAVACNKGRTAYGRDTRFLIRFQLRSRRGRIRKLRCKVTVSEVERIILPPATRPAKSQADTNEV